MCGIVGFAGTGRAVPVLLDGLRRLEYRGYDSAGLAVLDGGALAVRKGVGRVADLDRMVRGDEPAGSTGIAHTRWATHGGVTKANAHPQLDARERIAVVHNGIIENVSVLRQRLVAEGVAFRSETDTEVLPHLVRRYYDGDPVAAVCRALEQVEGTYGIAVLFADHPGLLVVARNGSPLVLGLGDHASYVASDHHALVPYTRRVIYLDDGEVARLEPGGVETSLLGGGRSAHRIHELDDAYGTEELEGFEHYMLKEIHEQPASIRRCLRGRLQERDGTARLGGFQVSPRELARLRRVCLLGCGTSYNAGLLGAMAVESVARVPARAEVASEFHGRNPVIDPDALYLAVSQSGETFDTMAAVREVQLKGGRVFGIVNVVGSSIARACGAGVYVHSGPEIAVASTKAFTSQVTALMIFTLMLGRNRVLSLHQGRALARALAELPERVAEWLSEPGPIDRAVDLVLERRYALFIGRGVSWPVAMEGALKLKEVAYVPCEAWAAGEMKHGPIAMLERGTPVVAIVPPDEQRDRALSNVQEVMARGARVVVVHGAGDAEAAALGEVALPVPATHPLLSPLVTVLPLQVLAYRVALALDRDIDRPRNLAKSVTVE